MGKWAHEELKMVCLSSSCAHFWCFSDTISTTSEMSQKVLVIWRTTERVIIFLQFAGDFWQFGKCPCVQFVVGVCHFQTVMKIVGKFWRNEGTNSLNSSGQLLAACIKHIFLALLTQGRMCIHRSQFHSGAHASWAKRNGWHEAACLRLQLANRAPSTTQRNSKNDTNTRSRHIPKEYQLRKKQHCYALCCHVHTVWLSLWLIFTIW